MNAESGKNPRLSKTDVAETTLLEDRGYAHLMSKRFDRARAATRA